jgi:hypothetical protein
VLAEARDLLGGNGVLLDFHVVRHMADIESIHTYEGTETMHVPGRDERNRGSSAVEPRSCSSRRGEAMNVGQVFRESARMYPDRPAVRLDELLISSPSSTSRPDARRTG